MRAKLCLFSHEGGSLVSTYSSDSDDSDDSGKDLAILAGPVANTFSVDATPLTAPVQAVESEVSFCNDCAANNQAVRDDESLKLQESPRQEILHVLATETAKSPSSLQAGSLPESKPDECDGFPAPLVTVNLSSILNEDATAMSSNDVSCGGAQSKLDPVAIQEVKVPLVDIQTNKSSQIAKTGKSSRRSRSPQPKKHSRKMRGYSQSPDTGSDSSDSDDNKSSKKSKKSKKNKHRSRIRSSSSRSRSRSRRRSRSASRKRGRRERSRSRDRSSRQSKKHRRDSDRKKHKRRRSSRSRSR